MKEFIPVEVTKLVKDDYMAYALAVLVGRAIPDLYDGLKPATRRIMTAMKWLNLRPDGRYMKSARVEGETMGKLHPHGGAYGSMVTNAQPHSNNIPLIDGWGNWGSSTDGAAASRYTECKLSKFAWDCMLDHSETWQTVPNYDGSLQEPSQLNCSVPFALLNGSEGIGVGYATHVLPHNLKGILKAVAYLSMVKDGKNNQKWITLSEDELVPDFPTGCDIVEDEALALYKKSGVGSIRCRAKSERSVKEKEGRAKERYVLTFTHLPPYVNPEKLGGQIKSELEKGRISGVAQVVDESDLTGDRVVVVAKPGVDVDKLETELYAFTDLDTKVSAKTLLIDNLKPVEVSPTELVRKWIVWRLARLEVQFRHEVGIAEKRLHILEGLLRSLDMMDEVIKTIRASANKAEAVAALCTGIFQFSKEQADAILEMKLRQLTNLDKDDLQTESARLTLRVAELWELIQEPSNRMKYVLDEQKGISKRFGVDRKCSLIGAPARVVITKEKGDSKPVIASAPKPRFLKIDMKKGLVEQVKGPRGAMVVDRSEKMIFMTEDGFLRKVPSSFKGPISTSGFSPVALAGRVTEVSQRSYLAVFELGGQLKAVTLPGDRLCRATSTGKRWLPEGAVLRHFGEKSYTVEWKSSRKKPLELARTTVKVGNPGSPGVKVAALEDLKEASAG